MYGTLWFFIILFSTYVINLIFIIIDMRWGQHLLGKGYCSVMEWDVNSIGMQFFASPIMFWLIPLVYITTAISRFILYLGGKENRGW